MSIRGKVVRGRGDFGQWIERLGDFYEHKTGMRLYPGTLNVELPSAYRLPPDAMRLEATEYAVNVMAPFADDARRLLAGLHA